MLTRMPKPSSSKASPRDAILGSRLSIAVPGPLAKVRDGDIVRVDAVAGTLDLLVDDAEWAARAPAPFNAPSPTGFGRELFTNFRRHAGGAEQGACTWL